MSVIVQQSNGEIIPLSSTNEYRWEIADYLSQADKLKCIGEKLISPTFAIDTNGGESSQWNLELYPHGFNDSSAGHCAVLLTTNSRVPLGVSFKFFVVDGNNRISYAHQSAETTLNDDVKTGALLMKSALLQSKTNNPILVDGKLILRCEITVTREQGSIVDNTHRLNLEQRLARFDRFESLLNSKKHHDLTFEVEGKKLYAHKVIVSLGNPTFAAMLEHATKESESNRIVIEDACYVVFKELLRFIYCGKVLAIDEIADRLFVVADKYQMIELKEMCENSLRKNLSAENVVAMLKLAELHHAGKQLRDAAVRLMVSRAQDLIDDPDLYSMLQTRQSTMMGFIKGLIDRKSSE